MGDLVSDPRFQMQFIGDKVLQIVHLGIIIIKFWYCIELSKCRPIRDNMLCWKTCFL